MMTTDSSSARDCLRDARTRCPPTDDCSLAQPRECLVSHIPAWRRGIDYGRVSCCLRCCLLQWVRRLNLERNYAHWRERGVNHFVHNGAGGVSQRVDRRAVGAPPPHVMPIDWMLNSRFAISRFAHFVAIESRDLSGLNASTHARVLRGEQYRVPHVWRTTNGTLIVLNGWSHSPSLLSRVAATLPPHGPIALVYGDDVAWTADQAQGFRAAIESAGSSSSAATAAAAADLHSKRGEWHHPQHVLTRHFAMNLDASAVRLPFTQQIPIGLNGASAELPPLLSSADSRGLQASASHRSSTLLCCCQRPWPQRGAAFEALRRAGHTHCNLTERRPYTTLFKSYLHHRFVVSAHGHGRTDFREWEILLAGLPTQPSQTLDYSQPRLAPRVHMRRPLPACSDKTISCSSSRCAKGAVPVVQFFPEHDELFDGLPIVRVRDWATVTPQFLDGEYGRLQREARAGHIGLAKVYFPFWFQQFTAHMSEVR